ncbi:hypothetical protein MSG28_002000 [Choristoneura fumiferana]|uniref:Uncharacterized protein n=2 Tax=Choristoneura fumiferana TaxID=7141 RepID=A0ACC0JTH5_CHOFU|nr:hypothetical protein MSG28_002000 [Choristoneura fumiferana]
MTTRIERMVFNYGTTNRTDYRNYDIKKSEPTVYKPKTKKEKRVPYLGKDSETVTEYKAKNIPFNLLWKPKPIIRTKPTDVPLKYDKIKDEEREESQRTRPRLVMTPAVSLDDVTDATARDIVCRDMYVSTWSHDSQLALALPAVRAVAAPLPSHPTPANPIRLPRLAPPVVPPEWRRETVEWDRRQLRGHVDPDHLFWQAFDPYKS